jgi:predicted Zn-dependent protease
LALRDQPGGAQEALALLARNAGPKGLHVEDERVACFVLSRIAGRQFEAARRFEATLKDQPLSPQERFLLVQIYVAQGDEDKAAKEMGILLAIQRDNPSFLAYHVQRLLQQSDRNAARTYLGMLEALEPSSPRTLQLKSAVGPMRTN